MPVLTMFPLHDTFTSLPCPQLFTHFISQLNAAMYAENRHIVVLLDNASSHMLRSEHAWSEIVCGMRTTCMSNVRLVFLPPNTTAFIQPLDHGIIAIAKARYRQHWLRAFSALWNADGATSAVARYRPNLCDVLGWLSAAWTSVGARTIQRCWWRTGCLPLSWSMDLPHVHDDEPIPPVCPDIELDDDIDDVGTLISGLGLGTGAMTAAEYVAIDDGEPTCAEGAAAQPTTEPEADMVVELWEAPTTMQAVYDDADPVAREARRTARAACEMLIGYARATRITPRDLCHLFDIRNPIIIARMERASPSFNLNVTPLPVSTPGATPTPETPRPCGRVLPGWMTQPSRRQQLLDAGVGAVMDGYVDAAEWMRLDYTGGWDPANKDYWASVVWSVVYAPLLGLLWLILGLGIVGFSLLTCLCCRDKWTEMRDPAYAKYTKKDLWVPLGFMLLGIVAVLVGFSVMVAGGVQLHNRVSTVTQYVTEQVDFTASVIFNLSNIVETSSSITVANAVIPAEKKADIENKARVANQTATDLQAKTADGINLVNNGLRVLSITFYVIGCVITALCILALLFSLLKWVVASNIIITLIWVVVFFTWCMTAGLLIAYLVNGDTSVALEQVQQSPTVNSAMDKYLHCIPSEKLLNATRYARYTAATVLTTANSSVASNAPRLFAFLRVPGGICVPYGPAPNFTRDTDLCVEGTILFPQFVNMLMRTAGSTALVPEVVRNDLTATAQTLALLESTIPNVLILVDCSYVANIAKFALSEAQAMVTNFQMLWVGFLVITIACMMQALSMPIYVFRAVRLGDKLSDAEVEGLYKASAVPVAYPAGGEGEGQMPMNEPSFAEGSDNSYAGESGAGYK
ncbi:unnamed protein product [Closterium sp. Naga37s-1]|nr:unnamed protein product [Closterium sp. Naga37s-1]